MSNDEVVRRLDEIEQAFRREDPSFPGRFRRLEPYSRLRVATVVLLLVSGAVLLTISVATLSFAVWLAGAVALLASFLVDHRRPTRHGVPRSTDPNTIKGWSTAAMPTMHRSTLLLGPRHHSKTQMD
jgi:hypothetical protein